VTRAGATRHVRGVPDGCPLRAVPHFEEFR
jgi:hypothetical protein